MTNIELIQQEAEKRYPMQYNEFDDEDDELMAERNSFISGANFGLSLNEWIPCSERLPTKEDADETLEVLAYRGRSGCYVEPWDDTSHNTTHWIKLPTPPKTEL